MMYIYIYKGLPFSINHPSVYCRSDLFHEINHVASGVPPFRKTPVYIYIYIYEIINHNWKCIFNVLKIISYNTWNLPWELPMNIGTSIITTLIITIIKQQQQQHNRT